MLTEQRDQGPVTCAHAVVCVTVENPGLRKVKGAQSCLTLQPHRLYSPWNSPDQNSGVGSLSLLQGIFLTQKSNWGLLRCRRILYQLSYQSLGNPIFCNRLQANLTSHFLGGGIFFYLSCCLLYSLHEKTSQKIDLPQI